MYATCGSLVVLLAVGQGEDALAASIVDAAADTNDVLALVPLQRPASGCAAAGGGSRDQLQLGLGPAHVALGSGAKVVYHPWQPRQGEKKAGRQRPRLTVYPAPVVRLVLNSRHAAVLLAGGTAMLHAIDAGPLTPSSVFQDPKTFGPGISCISMTEHFFLYGTQDGEVKAFSLATWLSLDLDEKQQQQQQQQQQQLTPRLSVGTSSIISSLYPNSLGTRVLYMVASEGAYLHDPRGATRDLLLPDFPVGWEEPPLVLWDIVDRDVIMVHDGARLHTYIYAPSTTQGPMVSKLGPLDVVGPEGQVRIQPQAHDFPRPYVPVVSCGGRLVSISVARGAPQLKKFIAPAYKALLELTHSTASPTSLSRSTLETSFNQSLALLRHEDAWRTALLLEDRTCWRALGNRAVEVLDMDLAIRVYRQLGDAGMVLGLEELRGTEDKNLVAGYASLLFGHHERAEALFLLSSRPLAAVELRRDLLQYDRALALARVAALEAVAALSLQYARQLELQGHYEDALRSYEMAGDDRAGSVDVALPCACTRGRARCLLRLGQIRNGLVLARTVDDFHFLRECAGILEGNRATLLEAASLYQQARRPERAVCIHLQAKDLDAAAALMPAVTSSKLHARYARACEDVGRRAAAIDSYGRAHDVDSVVRLLLSAELNRPEEAFQVVRASGSASAARMTAKYCQDRDDTRQAIEFLLLAQRPEEALDYAISQHHVSAYVQAVGDRLSPADARRIAQCYEARNELEAAASFYTRSHDFGKALKLALQCEDLEQAVAIVAESRGQDAELRGRVLQFLHADVDGREQRREYIFRLHLALGEYADAAAAATTWAQRQHAAGQYGPAHMTLYQSIRSLEARQAAVPLDMRQHFNILHSYVLAKVLIRHGNHEGAARLLVRVARHIDRFPCHAVPILTSAVVECQRAGFEETACEFASVLVTDPRHRQEVEPALRRKMETMVRRRPLLARHDCGQECVHQRPGLALREEDGPLAPCPIDGIAMPSMSLYCPHSSKALPMCVVTGRHMEADDWCLCPNSGLPALRSEYHAFIAAEARALGVPEDQVVDPVCGLPVRRADLVAVLPADVAPLIAIYNNRAN